MHRALFLFLVLWQVCRGADLAAFEIEFDKRPDKPPNNPDGSPPPKDSWDGNSCQKWRIQLQSAYNEAAELVAAAIKDIEVVSKARPDGGDLKDEKSRRDYENWNRIDRNLLEFFGFSVNVNNPDPNSGYLKEVLDVFKPMHKTFEGSEAKLNYDLKFGKPAIACGDGGWEYIAPGETDPNDLSKRNLRDVEEREAFKDTGAWVYKSRYLWLKDRTTKEAPNLCRKEAANVAVVAQQADILTLCLREGDEHQTVIDRSIVKKGARMNDLTEPDVGMCMSVTMVHEFAHLFGAWGDPTREDWPKATKEHPNEDRAVIDQQAVDKDGNLLYGKRKVYSDGEVGYENTVDALGDNGVANPKQSVYLFTKVANLAKTHQDNTNSGPSKSVNTAEAYAYFAVASLFSNFDWTGNGLAKEFAVNN